MASYLLFVRHSRMMNRVTSQSVSLENNPLRRYVWQNDFMAYTISCNNCQWQIPFYELTYLYVFPIRPIYHVDPCSFCIDY